jgi:putative peptidoglycan lipid II flippase
MFKVVRTLLLGGLVGKVLGVLRELIFAWLFGTGAVASAYRLAQSAFLIPLHGFVSETINSGFTPQYAAQRRTEPHSAAALFSGLYTVLLLLSVCVAVALFVWAPLWVAALAPGFDAERSRIATTMLQILAVALPAYVISGLFASVDLAMGRGSLSASRASLQSIGLIVGTFAASWFGMPSLIAVGFVASFIVLFFIGRRVILSEGLSLCVVLALSPEIKIAMIRLFKVVGVLIWIPIAFQVNSVIERRVASLVSTDAMAAVDYARFVTETLIILVAMPFGLAGLSTMASMSEVELREAQLRAFRVLLYVGIPLSALLHANAPMVVELVFERGAFGASSVAVTTQILSGMAIGIWGQLLGYAGAKFLSARGRNASALTASLAGVTCSISILLLAQTALGVSVLGIAAAAQSIVFGTFVLWQLKAIRELGLELFSLLALALIYVVVLMSVFDWSPHNYWLNTVFSLVFWLLALCSLPWHRRTLIKAFSLVWSKF